MITIIAIGKKYIVMINFRTNAFAYFISIKHSNLKSKCIFCTRLIKIMECFETVFKNPAARKNSLIFHIQNGGYQFHSNNLLFDVNILFHEYLGILLYNFGNLTGLHQFFGESIFGKKWPLCSFRSISFSKKVKMAKKYNLETFHISSKNLKIFWKSEFWSI